MATDEHGAARAKIETRQHGSDDRHARVRGSERVAAATSANRLVALAFALSLSACKSKHVPKYGWTPSPLGAASPARRIQWQLACADGLTTLQDGWGAEISCGSGDQAPWSVTVRNDGRVASILLFGRSRRDLTRLRDDALPLLAGDRTGHLMEMIDESTSTQHLELDGVDVSVRNVNQPRFFLVQWQARVSELSDE